MAEWVAAVAKAIATKVSVELGERTGSTFWRRVTGDPVEKALKRALASAFSVAQAKHRVVMGEFDLNFDFLSYEGADQVARTLLPGPRPEPEALATLCVSRSAPTLPLNRRRDREARLIPVFQTFLDALDDEIGKERELDEAMLKVRAARVTDAHVGIARHAGALRATATDETRYLNWVIDRHRTIRSIGMVKSHGQVQFPLDEVFVTLMAERDSRPGDRSPQWHAEQRRHLDAQLADGDLDPVTYEGEVDRLEQRLGGRSGSDASDPKPVDLTTVVARSSLLLILGDPGSGKTTLLRYLAHTAAAERRSAGGNAELGREAPRFPIFVRVGEFARSPNRRLGLLDFLPGYCRAHACTAHALSDLFQRKLEAGSCLVLLDGLDEVVSLQDRKTVVDAVVEFVDAHRRAGNRFVVTSRISGYNAAPLPPSFDAYRVHPMDDATIERFLKQYWPAIERFESPESSEETIAERAARSIAELLGAFQTNPGIRRLATNPLLLTTLMLVHRATGRLPSRRIDAYVEMTNALAGQWRIAHGIQPEELPDERMLKAWLTQLGGWLHATRPDGAATKRELVQVLGPAWARIQGTTWDDSVMGAADPFDSPAAREIVAIIEQADVQTGLLVERAPERYGFPHLTFEEFYAGRALMFEGKAADRAKRVRDVLHDSRYEEPILLGLGLLGSDHVDQIDDLVESAIYGHKITEPSSHEDLLGRDFLFALRVLGDDIAVSTRWIDLVVGSLVDEWLDDTSRCRFTRYRRAVEDRLSGLAGTVGARRLVRALDLRTDRHAAASERFCTLAARVATVAELSQPIVQALSGLVTAGTDQKVQVEAGKALASAGALSAPVAEVMTSLATNAEDPEIRLGASQALFEGAEAKEHATGVLINIATESHDWDLRTNAARALTDASADIGREALATLAIKADSLEVRVRAGSALARGDALSERVVDALFAIGTGADDPVLRLEATEALGAEQSPTEPSLSALTALATTAEDPDVRTRAAFRLAYTTALDRSVVEALLTQASAVASGRSLRLDAARALGARHSASEPAVMALVRLAATATDPSVRLEAAIALAEQRSFSEPVVETVVAAILSTMSYSYERRKAISALALGGPLSEPTTERLLSVLTGSMDTEIRIAAGSALAKARQTSEVVVHELTALATRVDDPDVQAQALVALGSAERLSEDGAGVLASFAAGDALYAARVEAVQALATTPTADRVVAMVTLLTNPDNDVRAAAAATLAGWGRRGGPIAELATNALVGACHDPTFQVVDRYDKRSGWDYAYDGLWAAAAGSRGNLAGAPHP